MPKPLSAERGRKIGGKGASQEGSVTLVALVVLVLLAGACISLLSISTARSRETRAACEHLKAFYVAEAGLGAAMAEITAGCDYDGDGLGTVSGTLGGGAFSVTATDTGRGAWRLTCTGIHGGCARAINTVVRLKPEGLFSCLFFGMDEVKVTGNAFCDSYDSAAGTYESQVSGDHAGENGDIFSNGDIMAAGYVKVYGDARPGPEGSVNESGIVYIHGSTCPAEEERPVPSYVYAPEGDALPRLDSSITLASGTFRYEEIRLSASDTLCLGVYPGDVVTIYVDEAISVTANAKIEVRDGASASMHHGGLANSGIVLAGRSVVNESGMPASFILYSACTRNVNVAGRRDFHGAILAPRANVMLAGNHEFFGAVVARTVSLFARNVHYDEALGSIRSAGPVRLETISWREATP